MIYRGLFPGKNKADGGAGASTRFARTFLLLTMLSALAAGAAKSPKPALTKPSRLTYAELPLVFERNCGQTNHAVKFVTRGSGYAAFFTRTETVMVLERNALLGKKAPHAGEFPGPVPGRENRTEESVLRLRWAGANLLARVEGLQRQSGSSNYLIGDNPSKWVRYVPAYSKVEYRGVYPGIDVVYYGSRRRLEFDLDVAPGAGLGSVHLQIVGGNSSPVRLSLNRQGALVVHTRAGDVRFHKPRAYQPDDSGLGKRFLLARYVIGKRGRVGFEVNGYNPAKPLVIDPVLSYSTYLGGSDYNYATGVAVDSAGNTYITGYTTSVDFPVDGGVQGIFAGGSCDTVVNTAPCFDAFVSKLNPQGTALIYSTYLGGTGDDRGVRIAVDSSGQAYVAGFTDSTDFPTAGALQGSNGGGSCGTTAYPTPCYDAFVTKLSASGSSLVYSTYLGGTGDDFSSGIAADSSGDAYVAGLTSASNFPITPGALQTGYGGGTFDGFVAKINPTGSALLYSTYLGGSQEDHVNGVAVDASGDAFLTGQTNSPNFPTRGGFQTKYTAGSCGSALSNMPCFEAFASELNPDGSALLYSSYLGGSAASYGSGIALDSSGAAYVSGWTTSGDFPVTKGAYDTTWGGGNEVFVAKINPAGNAIDYATYLGDINPDQANAIAVDGSGDAWITGFAYGGKFPLASPLQNVSGGFYDAIVSEFDPTGSTLLFSTYLGGSGDEAGNDLALDSLGNIYVSGDTFSADFPVTPSAMTTGYTGGSYDAWIARISPQNAAGLTVVPDPLVFGSQEINTTSAPFILKLDAAGSAALSISGISTTGGFAETSQCGQTVSPGTLCTINVFFTPKSIGQQTGTLVVMDNVAGSPQTVQLSGYGTSGMAGLSATSLSFGNVALGSTSTQAVTLTNLAQSPLDISGIQAGGDYSQSNNCGSVVNAGSSCTISVSFTPSALGTSVGTVSITDTAPGSPQTITLTGTGVVPFTLSANPSSETVLQGTGQVQFTVSASTTGGFTGSIGLGCSNVAPATCMFNPALIQPGQSSTLTVGNLAAVTSPSLNFSVTGTVPPSSQLSTSSSTTSSSASSASGSMTATLTLSVQITNFTLATSPSSASVSAGQTASYTLTLTPLNGFNVPVEFACSGAPSGASCSFSSPTLQAGGSGSLQNMFTVQTTARSTVYLPPSDWRGGAGRWIWVWCGLLGFALFAVLDHRSVVVSSAVRFVWVVIAFSVLLAACGGGSGGGGGAPSGQSRGTPAGTYTITVTATAQSLSHSSQVTLQVK